MQIPVPFFSVNAAFKGAFIASSVGGQISQPCRSQVSPVIVFLHSFRLSGFQKKSRFALHGFSGRICPRELGTADAEAANGSSWYAPNTNAVAFGA